MFQEPKLHAKTKDGTGFVFTEALPFMLVRAVERREFEEVSSVREIAYEAHLPGDGRRLSSIEDCDLDPSTVVYLCRNKIDGAAIGTMRIQMASKRPLLIETSVALPADIAGWPRVELSRLAVWPGADRRVRLALMKASYFLCAAEGVRWMVIGARSEALIRIYRGLGFREIFGSGVRLPLEHAGGIPHGVLAFDIDAAEREWRRIRHPLYGFMVESLHPDIHWNR